MNCMHIIRGMYKELYRCCYRFKQSNTRILFRRISLHCVIIRNSVKRLNFSKLPNYKCQLCVGAYMGSCFVSFLCRKKSNIYFNISPSNNTGDLVVQQSQLNHSYFIKFDTAYSSVDIEYYSNLNMEFQPQIYIYLLLDKMANKMLEMSKIMFISYTIENMNSGYKDFVKVYIIF